MNTVLHEANERIKFPLRKLFINMLSPSVSYSWGNANGLEACSGTACLADAGTKQQWCAYAVCWQRFSSWHANNHMPCIQGHPEGVLLSAHSVTCVYLFAVLHAVVVQGVEGAAHTGWAV